MKTITKIYTGLLVLGLLCLSGIAAAQQDPSATDASGTLLTDDIQPYNGPIGPDSPLYGLKIALEDMDESFTVSETERVDKQMDHARLRLSEARRSLDLNQSDSAQQALNNYWLKMNLTNATITRWGSNTTGLLHAQEMIVKHQFVLEHLLETHPNNIGLQRAYNNSLRLEEKFTDKTEVKFQRIIDEDNQTILILKAIRLQKEDLIGHSLPYENTTVTITQPDNHKKELKQHGLPEGYLQDENITVITQPDNHQKELKQHGLPEGYLQDENITVITQAPSEDQQNGNSGDKGKGNSKNK
jgi:hypothetical protein